MKQNWLHKFIATVVTAVVLLPFLVQALHALEDHEHFICNAKFEKHYHKDEIDCSIFHFQIEHKVLDFSFDFSFKNFETFTHQVLEVLQLEYTVYSNHKSSRAPPYLV